MTYKDLCLKVSFNKKIPESCLYCSFCETVYFGFSSMSHQCELLDKRVENPSCSVEDFVKYVIEEY